MKIKVETTNHLSTEEIALLSQACEAIANIDCADALQTVADELRVRLADWFVYRGGSHIAIHRRDNDWRRCAMVMENSPRIGRRRIA